MTKTKNAPRSKGLNQLNELVKLVPDERKIIARELVTEIGFMASTLAGLKKEIVTRGAIELFKQGKQEFLRENPALKAYNTTIQRYSLLYKQLTELLPKPVNVNADSDFLDFVTQN
jgi:hypothetical protein